VRCHTEYFDCIGHSEASSIATVDSDADTNVLGRDWLIVSEDPLRRINLIGFDAAYAQKRGLLLVTADTIVMTEDGQEVILRAHQSVSNPLTRTTLLSEVRGGGGGAFCAQVLYGLGLTSHCLNVYGMDSKSQVPEVYKRFIHDEGIPSGLHRDLAPEQKESMVTKITREYVIKESFAEAGNPNQNPVQSQAIKWLKRAGEPIKRVHQSSCG
jgi:hypothetical protein